MRGLVSITVLALAAAFATQAFAGPGGIPTTKSDCEKAKMHWNTEIGKCEPNITPSDKQNDQQKQ
jgi:hypothetical protein